MPAWKPCENDGRIQNSVWSVQKTILKIKKAIDGLNIFTERKCAAKTVLWHWHQIRDKNVMLERASGLNVRLMWLQTLPHQSVI